MLTLQLVSVRMPLSHSLRCMKLLVCSDTVTIPDIAALSLRQSLPFDWNAFSWGKKR